MRQLLDRLIPTDDQHTVIEGGKWYTIEIIAQNLMTFRVPCKQQQDGKTDLPLQSPAKFML